MLDPGLRLGHYEIRSKIGEGGMGEVYLAEDTKLHRRVAIKFLPLDSAANEQANKRLLREAQAAAKLDHPNICAVHEVAEEDGRSFIVMPYVEGETLDRRLKRKPLDLSETLSIAAQVADALGEAHEAGIIHRDIKPSNIIIAPRGQARVMDFGLAKLSAGDGLTVDAEASTQALLTTPGTIIGTIRYMSPEQVHGQPLDARTDVFSFGIVLYEMLTGQQPFAAESPAGTISAILTREPAPVSDYLTLCPFELQHIVRKCLEKERERRYQNMRDAAIDIENVRRECASGHRLSIPTERQSTKKSKVAVAKAARYPRFFLTRNRVTVVTIIVIAIAVAVYGILFRTSRNVVTPSATSVNSPAYDYYLRGKVNVASQSRERNENAIKLLEQAVVADPNFAPAYAELARAYIIKAFRFAPDAEKKRLNEDAEVAVEKALTLNPDLPEGHFARGQLLWTQARGFPHELAIQSLKRALALNPNLDEAHDQLGQVYTHIGLLDKGRQELEKALAINPANTLARFRLGVVDLYQGKNEEALAIFKTIPREATTALDRSRATALFQLGRTHEASEIVEAYLRTYPTDEGGNMTSVKAMLLAQAGKQHEAEATILRAVEIGKGYGHFHHTTYTIALAYALMNKPEQAVKWLQMTADDGFPCYPLFENDPNLSNVRRDERFIAVMAKVKQQWERYNATL